jgi:WD40 repeat protein
LLNASFFQDIILGFDGSLYTPEGTVSIGSCTVDGTYDMAMDAAGNIYVSSSLTNTVVKFDNAGNCLGDFITAGSGGLNNPRGLTFLPNGDLLVNSHNSGQILRYDGTTGTYLGVFSNGSDISPIASMAPHMTIKYGPDGAVWVADHSNNRILRFDATTGAFLSVFAQLPNGSGVRSFEFSGNYVLVSRHNVDVVAMYNYNTGAYIGDFADSGDGLDGPTGITYGPDGKVYIGSLNNNQILVFDALGTLLTTISANSPKDILFKCGECFAATCALTVDSATPTACNPATNTYSLDVVVTYSNAPSGNITVTTSNGGSVTVAQTSSPQTITITGLTSDGTQDIDITATFVGDAACTHTLADAYDAPASCSPPFVACGDIPVIWLVDEDQAAPSMHLWSFKDYNDATNTGTDYGRVTYIDPITGDTTAFATSSAHGDLESMAVNQSTGQAYFTTASKIAGGPSGGQTLFTYNLNDAAANKGKIALTVIGHIQRPNSWAAEVLALYNNHLYLADPVTGGQNTDTNTDILMSVDLGALNPNVMQNTIPTIIGPIQGLGQVNNYVDGMEILPDGTLYTVDGTDDHLYRVSLTTGAILEVVDNNIPGGIDPLADVETIVWDPVNSKLIGADNELQQFVDLTLDGTNGNNIVTSPYIGTPGIYNLVDFEGSAMFVMCCDLTVNSAIPSACDVNGQYTLSVDVTYTNVSGDITINGQSFTPSGVTGRDTFVLVLLTADGAVDVDVTAQSVTEATCSGTLVDAYDAPVSCIAACALTVDSATPTTCNPATNTYDLAVTVSYTNPPHRRHYHQCRRH